MIPEPLMEIIADRALIIIRQLGWTWLSTQRTDDAIIITTSLNIPNATPQFLTTQTHRLESILESLDWHLANINIAGTTVTAQFEYILTPPAPARPRTLQEEEEAQPT